MAIIRLFGRVARGGVGVLAVAGLARVLVWACGSPVAAFAGAMSSGVMSSGGADFDRLFASVVGLAAWAGLLWLVGVTALELAARAPGAVGECCSRASAAISPRFLRASARWIVGASLLASPLVSTSALAATSGAPTPSLDRPAVVATIPSPAPVVPTTPSTALPVTKPAITPSAAPSAVLGTADPLNLDRPATPYVPPPPPAPAKVATPSGVEALAGAPHRDTADDGYVVRRGDTLWSIAARHLGTDATAADVVRDWPRWYAANRAVIGADPALIKPGMVLAPPPSNAPPHVPSSG